MSHAPWRSGSRERSRFPRFDPACKPGTRTDDARHTQACGTFADERRGGPGDEPGRVHRQAYTFLVASFAAGVSGNVGGATAAASGEHYSAHNAARSVGVENRLSVRRDRFWRTRLSWSSSRRGRRSPPFDSLREAGPRPWRLRLRSRLSYTEIIDCAAFVRGRPF